MRATKITMPQSGEDPNKNENRATIFYHRPISELNKIKEAADPDDDPIFKL